MTLTRLPRALCATGLAVATLALVAGPAHSASALPPVKHVWTIILENSDEAATAAQDVAEGEGELTSTLAGQGANIVDYYATGHSSLDNYISMTSGQGPNPETQGDCQKDEVIGGDRAHATFNADGQALGTPVAIAAGQPGCVFPADVPSLATQLTNAGDTWKTYAQGMDLYPAKRRTTCPSPKFTGVLNDPTGTNSSFADNYRQKHDPFLYYLGVTGDGTQPSALCDSSEVGLDHLLPDLQQESTTPDYSLIIPDLCNDAHDSLFAGNTPPGCAANSAGPDSLTAATTNGVAQADLFLKAYVPAILASPAFKDNGLLMITFDEGTETVACCNEVTSPNLPAGADNGEPSEIPSSIPLAQGEFRGGGMIGMVAISPFITPGTVSTVPYNHYSYLRTMEDLFHLTPAATGIAGSDGQGHIGYAGSQGGSTANAPADFGSDVFTNPSAAPAPALPETRLAVLLPVAALLVGAGAMTARLRRQAAA